MNKLNNQELLELLKTDVKSFNVYREEYADQEIDFSNANLKGVNLQVRNSLKSANFVGAKLENVTITLTKENLEAIKGCEL